MVTTIGKVAESTAKELAAPQDTQPRRQVTKEGIAYTIEHAGWKQEVAGKDDFEMAVNAIYDAITKRLGLIYTGGNGCGKTCLMRAMWKSNPRSDKVWIDCTDPYRVAMLEGNVEEFLDTAIYLDDFGAARLKYGDYDIVGEFICRWCNCREGHPAGQLNITTNLTAEQINEIHGGRVLDRIYEQCNICPLAGESKRKINIFKKR